MIFKIQMPKTCAWTYIADVDEAEFHEWGSHEIFTVTNNGKYVNTRVRQIRPTRVDFGPKEPIRIIHGRKGNVRSIPCKLVRLRSHGLHPHVATFAYTTTACLIDRGKVVGWL